MFLILTASLAKALSKNRITYHIPLSMSRSVCFPCTLYLLLFVVCLSEISLLNSDWPFDSRSQHQIRISPVLSFSHVLTEDEETERCRVNMNFTKSPQANCESSLEKGREGRILPIIHHLSVLLAHLFTVLVQRQEPSSLLWLY